MQSTTQKPREIAEKRIGLILLVHGICLLVSASYPEGAFRIWFPITTGLEALLLLNLLRLWRKYKYQPKYYYTIHIYWLLAGMYFFISISILRMFYGAQAFWMVLLMVIGVFVYAQYKRENMLMVFVNPAERKRLVRLSFFIKIMILVGILLMAYSRVKYSNPNGGALIFMYLISVFGIFVGAPLSIPGERIEEIKKRVNQ
ncbi:hypothetical protein HNO89_002045 [Sporosarcina luteola]|nr:hypothetical protein [Sporosarcina luteola]